MRNNLLDVIFKFLKVTHLVRSLKQNGDVAQFYYRQIVLFQTTLRASNSAEGISEEDEVFLQEISRVRTTARHGGISGSRETEGHRLCRVKGCDLIVRLYECG